MIRFVIEELPRLGGSGIRSSPERFEWDPELMNAPQRPFNHPGKQRIRRKDYPGSVGEPTIQVLGPILVPMTFKGTWNDRYNGVGYAKAEKARFLGMCYRGNPIRILFDDIDLTGIISDWDFPYEKEWRIGYEFTLEPASDGIIGQTRTRSPGTVLAPRQLAEELETLFTDLELARSKPEVDESAAGTLFDRVADKIGLAREKLDQLNAVIDTRLSGPEGRDSLTRAVQVVRSVRIAAMEVVDNLVDAKADNSLKYRTATSELRFETWSRSVRASSNALGLSAFRAEQQIGERADPVAIATYRPAAGESLYDVSLKLFGTPHHWRELADRNRLETFILDGTEDLVVPELAGT